MTTNLTIDDSSADIIYSKDWVSQSSLDDPDTDKFFQSTYHSAQGDGASANLTFIGSAIYLYGSKGPKHANYSVQFDNFIIFYSANQSETQYQQLLFGQSFGSSDTHFVSLTVHHVSLDNNWLDLDYITITANETDSNSTVASTSTSASPPTSSPTISPPWLLDASSTEMSSGRASSTSATSPTASSPSSSSTNHITLILAAVFGSITFAALIFWAIFFIARRGKRRRDHQMPFRRDTAGTGTGAGAFIYKRPTSPASFFGGHMSPGSPDFVQSLTVRPNAFRDRMSPGLEHNRHTNAFGHAHNALSDGRKSPHSTLSMGGATVLTAASTAQLLNPHLHKSTDNELMHKHTDSVHVIGTTAARRTRSPLQHQHRLTSDHLPIYKQHRVYDSETAINALKGAAAAGITSREPAVVVLPGSPTPSLSEKPENRRTDRQALSESSHERPVPLMALHAAHRSDSNLSMSGQVPAVLPQRPKRPGDGLLDFLGSQIALRLERSATAKRRKDDANSERTNFLKV